MYLPLHGSPQLKCTFLSGDDEQMHIRHTRSRCPVNMFWIVPGRVLADIITCFVMDDKRVCAHGKNVVRGIVVFVVLSETGVSCL